MSKQDIPAMNTSSLQGTSAFASDRASSAPSAARWSAAAGALAVLALPLLSSSSFYVHLAVLICLNVVIVSGLAILNRTGQLSFCHASFVGLGAYGSALATMKLGLPFLLAVPLGALVAAAVAFVLGAAILRLHGVYFVLISFAFGELFRLTLLEGGDLTGGANGLSSIPGAVLFGLMLDTKKSFYCLAAVAAVAAVAFLWIMFRTPAGQILNAVGDNPRLAEATGLSVRKNQLFAFTLGSAFAGFGGALLAHYLGFVSPESFNMQVSVAAIIMLVVGGRYSVLGPLVGALIMTPLPELFRGAVQTQNIFYGVTLILILRFLPLGFASLPLLLRGRRKGGRK